MLLPFRQSIDCSFPASSSADKKKASEQTVLEIQGHVELGTKVFLSEEKHKSGQFYKRLWLEKENIEHLKSLFWLPANVRQRLYVRGKTWQWIILQTFGEIDFVLLAFFTFAISEVVFFWSRKIWNWGFCMWRFALRRVLKSAVASSAGFASRCGCEWWMYVDVFGNKKLFSYGLVAFQAQRFVSE